MHFSILLTFVATHLEKLRTLKKYSTLNLGPNQRSAICRNICKCVKFKIKFFKVRYEGISTFCSYRDTYYTYYYKI